VVVLAGAGLLALLVQSGWLTDQVRRTIVGHLASSLGRPVALGAVSGDLLHGFDLHDLVIAERGGFRRGVAFSADRVHLTVDWAGLLRSPGAVMAHVTGIDLWGPRLVLARDASGRWNVEDLLEAHRVPLGPGFRGRVTVHDGVVSYSDAWEVGPVPFGAQAEDVAGTIRFGSGTDARLDLRGRTASGEEVTLSGRYLGAERASDLVVTARHASVERWGNYLVRLAGLRWRGGRFDGRLRILGTGAAVDYAGQVSLRDASVAYEPRHLVAAHVTGPLRVDVTHVATDGLALVVDGSPLWVRGRLDYPGHPWLDVVVRSSRFDLGRIRSLFFPGASVDIAGEARGEVWVTGPVEDPVVDGTIAAATGRVDRQAFAGLRGRLRYAGDILALTGLRSAVAGGRVSGDLVVDLSGPSPSYTFTSQGTALDLAMLRAAWPALPKGLSGRVSGQAIGTGRGAQLRVVGDAALRPGTLAGQRIDSLRAFLWDDGGDLTIDYLRATVGPASVYARGRVGPGGSLDLAVEAYGVRGDGLRSAAGGASWPVAGEAAVAGRVQGSLEAPVFSGSLTAWDGKLGPVPFDLLEADIGSAGPEGVTLRRVDLFAGVARYHAEGTVGFHPLAATGLRIDARGVEAASFAPLLRGMPSISGTLSAHLTVDGPLTHPEVVGRLGLVDGQVAGQRLDEALADLASRGQRIRVVRLEARRGGSTLVAAGTVDPRGPIDLSAETRGLRLSDIDALARSGIVPQGTVDARGTIRGTLQAPEADVTVSSPDLLLRGQAFSASGRLRYRTGVVTFAPLELSQGTAQYRLQGELRLGPVPSADLALDVDRGQVSSLLGATGALLPVPVSGELDGRVTLQGELRDPAAQVAVTLRHGRIDSVPLESAVADATLTHGALDIRRLELRPEKGLVSARGRVVLRGTSAVEISAHDLAADTLRPLLGIRQPLEGSVDFTMQWGGPTSNPVAGVSLEAHDLGVPGATVDRLLGLAYYKDGVFHIESGVVEKGAHKALVQGALPLAPGRLALDPERPLSLAVRLQDADLTLLSLLSPQVHDASGTVQGQVTVGGTVLRPEMSGYVRTEGGTLRVDPLHTPIDDLRADVTFSQDEIVVRQLAATIGGGQADVHGTVSVRGLRPDAADLTFVGRHLTVDVPGVYAGGLDGALRLSGPAAHPVLEGRMILSHGQVGGALPQGSRGFSGLPVALDVTLQSGDDVRFAQGAVQTTLAGEVHVGGTPGAPRLAGRVQAVDGTITLLGTPFTLAQGEAVFSEALGFDPQITARAQAVIGDTRVFMTVGGVAPDLSVQWSSDPPMTQQEILALVTGSGAGGPAAGLVSQELGRLVLGSVGQAIQRALRLDEFSISYDTQSPITLRIGKFIVRNLYLSLAEVLVRPGPTNPVPLPGPLPRPTTHTQSYLALGVQYFLSPSVYLAYDVDSLGGSGVFLLTRFPF
jgi:translocation and assembly module TamB